MTTTFDAIIIGTGQAGPFLAGRLTAAGMKVAIIERGRFGGTCINTGCTPTKTMVASAHTAHMARRAADFGVTISGPVTRDMTGQSPKRCHHWEIQQRHRKHAQRHDQLHGISKGPRALRRLTR
jgi:pyruvate/2-oxoglutarate dehydrogenase complex dihydrolipoamide dehydrogenase (E3) component